jgi:hypothetical protein
MMNYFPKNDIVCVLSEVFTFCMQFISLLSMISGTNLMSQKVHVLSVVSHYHGFSLRRDRNIDELAVPLCSHLTFLCSLLNSNWCLILPSQFTSQHILRTS